MKKGLTFPKKMIIFCISIVLFVALLGLGWFFSVYFSERLDKNLLFSQKAEITVQSRSGNTVNNEKMYRYIEYKDISPHIVNAFVALEDKRFFDHKGVDYYRTVGAFVKNLQAGKIKQGGSTITQQLAKNTHLSGDRTLSRKVKEMRLAREIEQNFSKEQILELYLNAIYYGNGIYGIDSACKNYFGKTASEVTPAESAVLAGIVKNPSRYSPCGNEEASSERKNLVLRLMKEQKYISEKEYREGIAYEYRPPREDIDPFSCYYTAVLQEAANLLGITEKELICSPYTVRTYCDETVQQTLCKAVLSGQFDCTDTDGKKASTVTLLCDNQTGGVIGYFTQKDFNLFMTRRSPGSCIKPILVYAPALEKGILTPQTPILDEHIDFSGYSPKNFGGEYSGFITAQEALSRSVNTVAVKILQQTGIENAKEIAEKTGLAFDESDRHLALALGGMTYGVTLPEITSAYMTLACEGKYQPVTLIQSITNKGGKTVYRHKETKKDALSSATAFLTSSMLQTCVQSGTAKKMKGFSFDIGAKTGTAERNKKGNSDAWNISFTTQNTLCVWYGSDKEIQTTGGNLPTLLASHIYKNIPEPQKRNFVPPDTVVSCEIDEYALKTEQKLCRAHAFTPAVFRKSAYFSLLDCPQENSPYFDIFATDFNVERKENGIFVRYRADSPFRCVLIEKNMVTGESKEYPLESEEIFLDDRQGFFGYHLAFYYESEFLGYGTEKIILS